MTPQDAAAEPSRRILLLAHTGREEAREVSLDVVRALVANGSPRP